ncbi:MAG: CTP-dependent riboflavin kinase [Methanothermobacter sp.]|uniref:DUF120 domain-containing protein n=1 Tax=Methanothermobacter thermautotrophicus TaxID=145262 RepID=UPI0029FF531D|nr:DUF120 domain-containing protein [Methanothermobacter thermautotrophicus]MCQ8904101.1 CTP-dependent riboflavin kinase [Methanothermobacter sp.]
MRGTVKSGFGEGAYFITRSVYQEQFRKKLGFDPFPGTLNIEVGDPEILDRIKRGAPVIHGGGGFGDVLYVKAVLNGEVEGAILFPVKTHHRAGCLEFVAPVNLRKTLKLRDGDTVSLDIESDEVQE